MKRVLLIQPAFFSFLGIYSRYFPYHLVGIGTYLKNAGHEVRVLEGDGFGMDKDLNFSDQESKYANYLSELRQKRHHYWDALQKEIDIFKPDFIGITFWTTCIASSIKTAELCRKRCPKAIIMAGGPHVTLMPQDVIKLATIDIVVLGEGEQTVLEIVNGKPLHEIKGIYYRIHGRTKKNDSRPFISDLDLLGRPDRSLLANAENYKPEDLGLIMTSRGCPYSCAYCATSIWQKKVRFRSIDAIIDEMTHVNKEYGTIYFSIKDDSFTINKDRVFKFCEKLKEKKIKIYWECNANLVNIDKKMLSVMKDAGCIAIKIGIETGSDKIHKIINKKLTNKIIEKHWKILRSVDLHVTCYFMMGVPGETDDDINKTIEFAMRLQPDYISYSIYEIFPSTTLHRLGITEGIALDAMTIDEYLNIEPQHYFFKNHRRRLPGLSDEHYTALEVKFRTIFSKYNRSPKSIFARVKSRLPLYRIKISYFIDDLRSFFKWI